MKRRGIALLLTLLLLLGFGVFALPTHAAPYFLVANDNLPEATVYNTPIYVNGISYVPCTAFDRQHAGVSLGIGYVWDKDAGIITLSNGATVLEFNTETGKATDYPNRTEYNYQPAVVRNGLPYVPAADTCAFFGLQISFLDPEGCRLLRIKNGSEVIADSDYEAMARPILDSWIGSAEGGGNNNGGSGNIVTPPEEEPEGPVEEEPGEGGVVSVAIRVSSGENTAAMLTSLSQRGVKGIFFFTPQELLAQLDTVIDITNQGSRIGILPTGVTAQEQLESVAQGRELMAQLLQKRLIFVLDEALTQEVVAQLEGEGYLLWHAQLSINDLGRSSARIYQDTLEQIHGSHGYVRMLFSDDVPSGTMYSILRQLQEESYRFRTPRETSY